jgi:uncharacterized protein YwgA
MPSARQALLAGVLCRIGHFSVAKFQDRLRLQKTVYLLQAFGIYLGYNFNWYLYGPYSPGLTRDAFEVLPQMGRSSAVHFADQETERRFELFMKFLGDKKNDPQWLELVGSLHMLRLMYGEKRREAIFKKMAEKQPYLSEDKRVAAWQRLSEFEMV